MKALCALLAVLLCLPLLGGCSGDKVEAAVPVAGQKPNMKETEMKEQGSANPKPFDDTKKKGDALGG